MCVPGAERLQAPLVCIPALAPQVISALLRNLEKEKSTHLMLRGFLFGHTLTVRQFTQVRAVQCCVARGKARPATACCSKGGKQACAQGGCGC